MNIHYGANLTKICSSLELYLPYHTYHNEVLNTEWLSEINVTLHCIF